jgi:hypothetical protein
MQQCRKPMQGPIVSGLMASNQPLGARPATGHRRWPSESISNHCRDEVGNLGVDGLAQAFQNVREQSTPRDHSQGSFFRGQQCLGALSIINIGIRSLPFDNVAVIVAHGLCTEHEPSISSVVPADTCFHLASLSGS